MSLSHNAIRKTSQISHYVIIYTDCVPATLPATFVETMESLEIMECVGMLETQ